MNRRNYLSLLGVGGFAGLAGCGSSTSESTPTAESTATSTPTATASPALFEVVDFEVPDSAEMREVTTVEIEIENTGGTGGEWSGTLYRSITQGPEPEDWTSSEVVLDVPAGETATLETGAFRREVPTVVFYRLDDGPVHRLEIPEGEAPIIESTSLVSEWRTYGDAVDNALSEANVGDIITVASRYWAWSENSTNDMFIQVEIDDNLNDRVDISQRQFEQITEESGWGEWEGALRFDTSDWDPGTYTARMLIRDNQNQEVSNEGTDEFELV